MHDDVFGCYYIDANVEWQCHPDLIGLDRGIESGGKILLQNVFGGPAVLGRSGNVRRRSQDLGCCFAIIGSGTARKVFSACSSWAASRYPKILSGGLKAGFAAPVGVCGAGVVSCVLVKGRNVRKDRTAISKRTKDALLERMGSENLTISSLHHAGDRWILRGREP